MDKRERLEKILTGEVADRPPVALWCYWPGDDQRIADFAWSTLLFQKTFDWDFVKVSPYSAYCVADYGVATAWQGAACGDRTITRHRVQRSLDWTELRVLDPLRGELGKHIEAVKLIAKGLQETQTPFVVTLYSPLTQAAMLAGDSLLLGYLRTRPDRLQTALNTLTENTLRLIDALRQTGVSGVFYVMRHASFTLMAEEEYQAIGMPYDLKILGTLPAQYWLNVAHLDCPIPMFELASTYPVQAIHWHSTTTKPDLDEARALYQGVLCGGLAQREHLYEGTPTIIRDVIRNLFHKTGSRRFIFAAGGGVSVGTPLSNIRTVRETLDELRVG